MSDALNALLLPFAKELVAPPRPGRGFFLRAEAGVALDEEWRQRLVCEQSFKPAFDHLLSQGFQVKHSLTGDGFDVGLCLLTKHKAENLANLGRAWQALRPGGVLVGAGGNDVGAASVERALGAAVGEVNSLSKHHCKVFWSVRTDETPAPLAAWVAAGRLQFVLEIGCQSRPGLYSWDKVDEGSALLVDHLPGDLSGRVADVGAGWGYLSLRLLESGSPIASLDLFEAEWLALEAAKANLERFRDVTKIAFHWHDVAGGLPKGTFDTVLMNPPFHHGKGTDIDLGRAFLSAAAEALVPGGRLILVANRQLPYEAALRTAFRTCRTLVETGSFKVFQAER
jgi:16S rRNA (guanine1207-N2)-methyltransferase